MEEATEYVVVQTGSEDLQNVEIITEGGGEVLESVEVSGDYVLLNEDGENVRIIDSTTGETIATMPASSLTESATGEIIASLPETFTEVPVAETVSEDQISQSLIQSIDGENNVGNIQISEESCVENVQISEEQC